MDAQGALDSLVGRLTAILVDEAQLLGGLRGDVEFIKDEMESMNSLMRHLTEAQHRNHQVRTWMKHVVGLTRDCEGNVELYVRYVAGADHRANKGCFLRRVLLFVRTVPARHRVATRIRELKVRARDVGDRRLRYGVTVPTAAADQDDAIFMDDHVQAPEEEDARRRALLEYDGPEDEEAFIKKKMDEVIKLLYEEAPAQHLANGEPQPKVFHFCIVWEDEPDLPYYVYREEKKLADRIARRVHEREMSSFGCKAFVDMYNITVVKLLREILQQVAPLQQLPAEHQHDDDDKEEEAMQLTEILGRYLRGKRFLIILPGVDSTEKWSTKASHLLHAAADCSPGSAILITRHYDTVLDQSPCKTINPQSPLRVFDHKAKELMAGSAYGPTRLVEEILQLCLPHIFAMKMVLHLLYVNPRRGVTQLYEVTGILRLCHPDVFAMKMVLHLLYVNPRWVVTQLKKVTEILQGCRQANKSVEKQMVRLCYNDLPTKYKSCLLYLTIFPEGDPIRRTTVCRRWIAEGLIASRENLNRAQDEADSCFDALLSWRLTLPGEISDAGKIETCMLHHIVREVITRIARDVNFVDTDLSPDLARHLSIHSRSGVQASHSDCSVKAADGNGIVAFLPQLAKSSQWQLLKMLDLEGCIGLKKHHLKSICKILLLKYLSLRNTDVTELPKKIDKLQCLETLDIRQTAVKAFATKSVMLPMLKHLLAGQIKSPSNNSDGVQEPFTSVRLPSGIERMEKLETLSHVEVSRSVNDLIDVGHLLQLRKLGVNV